MDALFAQKGERAQGGFVVCADERICRDIQRKQLSGNAIPTFTVKGLKQNQGGIKRDARFLQCAAIPQIALHANVRLAGLHQGLEFAKSCLLYTSRCV